VQLVDLAVVGLEPLDGGAEAFLRGDRTVSGCMARSSGTAFISRVLFRQRSRNRWTRVAHSHPRKGASGVRERRS
jgi:hypothetical protein